MPEPAGVNNPTRRAISAARLPARLHHAVVLIVQGIAHVFGTDGRDWYNFWSGFGADVGQLALLGGAIGIYRKHNCHVHGCWRIAKQQVVGTSWTVCHRHHPEGRPTAEDVATAHARVRVAEREALDLAARVVGEKKEQHTDTPA